MTAPQSTAAKPRDEKPKTVTFPARQYRQILRVYRNRVDWAKKSGFGDIEDDATDIVETLEGATTATLFDLLPAADGLAILAALRGEVAPEVRTRALTKLFEEAYEQ